MCRTPDNLGSTLSRPALYCASDASSKGFAAYVLDTDFTFQQPFNTQARPSCAGPAICAAVLSTEPCRQPVLVMTG